MQGKTKDYLRQFEQSNLEPIDYSSQAVLNWFDKQAIKIDVGSKLTHELQVSAFMVITNIDYA